MSLVRRKIELAFFNYISSIPELESLTIYEGTSNNNEPALPCLIIESTDVTPHPEHPTSDRVFNVRLVICLKMNANDNSLLELDTLSGCIEAAMQDIEGIQNIVNKTADPDVREVTGIHVYDVLPITQDSEKNLDNWEEEFSFDIDCGEQDAF